MSLQSAELGPGDSLTGGGRGGFCTLQVWAASHTPPPVGICLPPPKAVFGAWFPFRQNTNQPPGAFSSQGSQDGASPWQHASRGHRRDFPVNGSSFWASVLPGISPEACRGLQPLPENRLFRTQPKHSFWLSCAVLEVTLKRGAPEHVQSADASVSSVWSCLLLAHQGPQLQVLRGGGAGSGPSACQVHFISFHVYPALPPRRAQPPSFP